MPKKTLRVLVSTVIIAGALVMVLFSSATEDAAYYKMVDEVMVSPEQWYGKPMQLHGHVVNGSMEWRKGTLDRRFKVKGAEHVVQASYSGVVPDTFKDGSEVVMKGTLGPNGFEVEPGGIMAKCPSRYEADKPTSTGSNPYGAATPSSTSAGK
jgi:cytochrome c-type biogenesis protein CcmE